MERQSNWRWRLPAKELRCKSPCEFDSRSLRIMKKRFAVIAALIFAVAGISACGTNEDNSPQSTKTGSSILTPVQPKNTIPTFLPDRDDIYLTSLRNTDSWFVAQNDGTLIDLAHSICMAFDDNATTMQVISIGISNGVPGKQVGESIAYAVINYCPSYLDKVSNDVKDYSSDI